MKLIPLSQDKFAMVDDEDFEYLNQWKWYANNPWNNLWYARRGFKVNKKSKSIDMHRVIMNVTDRKILVDHIDGNGLNNQRSNLRLVTPSQNNWNRRPKLGGTSKYIGVYLCKIKDRQKVYEYWRALITINYKTVYLGFYKNEEDAARAYNEAAIKYHQGFAKLNIIN